MKHLIAIALVLYLTIPAYSTTKLFILHSYEQAHICGAPQELGARSILSNYDVDIQVWAMDTKRKYNTPKLIKERASEAIARINEFKPDILYTLDDNAFNHVGLKYVDHSTIKVVFSGMNAQPPSHIGAIDSWEKPGHNITGVYEKLHVATAFRIINQIVPIDIVAVISDYSPTGKAITTQVLKELEEDSPGVPWYITQVASYEEYQTWVLNLNVSPHRTALYPVSLLLKDKDGKTYTAPEILSWTAKNATIPTLPANYAFIRLGMFGGAGVDFYAMGKQAGNMIVKIIHGANPGDIPIEQANKYALIFNLPTAKKLGIVIPEDILLVADEVIK